MQFLQNSKAVTYNFALLLLHFLGRYWFVITMKVIADVDDGGYTTLIYTACLELLTRWIHLVSHLSRS